MATASGYLLNVAAQKLSSQTSIYDDLPIDRSKDEIRLWKFARRDHSHELEMSIHALNDFPSFIALSYVWGTYEDAENVTINGHRVLKITRNLWEFLEDISSNQESRGGYFWADQISMNQQNLDERCHQVRLMSKIYSHANAVFACVAVSRSDRYSLKLSKDNPERRLALTLDLVNEPYWTRLWIVQELALASYRRFWCYGSVKTSQEMNDMILHATNATRHWDQAELVSSLLLGPFHGQSSDTLEAVLENFCGGYCQDPRDKIIGLQALVTPSQRINADYTKSLAYLMKEAFAVMLQNTDEPRLGRADDPMGDVVTWMLRKAEGWRKIGEMIDPTHQTNSVVTSFTWAYLIPSIPSFLRLNRWSENSPHALGKAWDGMLKLALRLAVTDGQQKLNQALRADRRRFLKSSRDVYALEGRDWFNYIVKVSMQAEDDIDRLARDHGFQMYGNLLCHPDEDPPLRLCSYKDWAQRKATERQSAGQAQWEVEDADHKAEEARHKAEEANAKVAEMLELIVSLGGQRYVQDRGWQNSERRATFSGRPRLHFQEL